MRYENVTQDTSGNAISGVAVTVKNADTGVLTTLYSDNAYGSTISNPQTSGADGSYGFYCKDARVDLSFVKTGYTFADHNDVDCFQPIGDHTKTPADFTTLAINTVTEGAIDKIGAAVTTFIINTPITCTATDTIPSTCTLLFVGEGSITVSAGQTLTVNGPVTNLTDHAVFLGTGTSTFANLSGPDPYGKKIRSAISYSASMAVNASLGTTFTIAVTNGVAFTINTPTKPAHNRRIRIQIRNTSGGAHGAITMGAGFKLGAVMPAIANGFNRSFEFEYDGSQWDEVSRSAVDVTN